MPRSGKQEIQAVLPQTPLLSGFGTEAWELKNAAILQLTFEIVEEPGDLLIPPALNPSIPPYATLSIMQFPESPVGPFALAQVRVIARAGIRPRGYLLGAYTNSDKALTELRGRWGFNVDKGDMRIDPRHDRVVGQVQRNGQTILAMEVENPEQISGADVMFTDSLHLVRAPINGKETPVLIQIDPEYVFHSAQRGRPRLLTFPADAWGGDGRLLYTNPITGVFVRCDTDLPKLRFALDPTVPVAQGRVKLAA
jgi:hypothetical protein